MAAINQLPLINVPGVFGLHSNAEIGYYTEATKEIWEHLITLQPQQGTADKAISREEVVIKSAEGILEKIPPKFEIDKLKIGLSEQHISPISVVFIQELNRFNLLIGHMRSSLNFLIKALHGEIGMDLVLDAIATNLYNGQIPNDWRILCPETRKNLGGWMGHFERRFEFFKKWFYQEKPPLSIWLAGFHLPGAFLTAVMQVSCRENRWPLDRSSMFTVVTNYPYEEDVVTRPKIITEDKGNIKGTTKSCITCKRCMNNSVNDGIINKKSSECKCVYGDVTIENLVENRNSFDQSSASKLHLNIHAKQKNFICNFCQKSFNFKSDLKKHVNIHTKEKNYVCNFCQKVFNRLSNLKAHINLPTKEKNYATFVRSLLIRVLL